MKTSPDQCEKPDVDTSGNYQLYRPFKRPADPVGLSDRPAIGDKPPMCWRDDDLADMEQDAQIQADRIRQEIAMSRERWQAHRRREKLVDHLLIAAFLVSIALYVVVSIRK